MSSRLYTEVREKRGLAYGISTGLVPLVHAQLITGSTATRADRTDDTLEIIDQEMKKLAENGPTEQELEKAKSFLKGSYGLYFDTSTKIANQLVRIQLENRGVTWLVERNRQIEAVSMADVRRTAVPVLMQQINVNVPAARQDESLDGNIVAVQ